MVVVVGDCGVKIRRSAEMAAGESHESVEKHRAAERPFRHVDGKMPLDVGNIKLSIWSAAESHDMKMKTMPNQSCQVLHVMVEEKGFLRNFKGQ